MYHEKDKCNFSFSWYYIVMIQRSTYLQIIQTALNRSRVVALIGPRQSGKTTLARQFVLPDSVNYFDLEDLASIARLQEPITALRDLRGVIVIDEIQRRPDLFPILRVLCDRDPLPAQFLILGSASPDVIRSSSESLAGRVETIPVSGFSLSGKFGNRQPGLAKEFYPNAIGTGFSSVGHTRPSGNTLTILDDARTLPRANLE
jgi:predicted AAA+ superfamily ATPase